MGKEYFLGLDIGTSSVGWAVTDTTDNYELFKKQGKSLWGVRLFSEADGAKDRRGFRSSRRRLARRKYRLHLLEELFKDEINKVDSEFFIKLHETDRVSEDKTIKSNPLLNNYPTIYHLRKKLLNPEYKPTIQELFFAVHHIIKKRGHFLFENDISKESVKEFENHLKAIEEKTTVNISFEELKDTFLSNTPMKKKIELMNPSKDKTRTVILSAIFGLTINVKNFLKSLPDFEFDEDSEEKTTFKFSDMNIEESLADFDTKYPDQSIILFELYAVYSLLIALKIIGERDYISDAMIDKYTSYKKDLLELKKLLKKHNLYDLYFRGTREAPGLYTKFTGKNVSEDNTEDDYLCEKITHDEFITSLKKDLNKILLNPDETDKEIIAGIFTRIENNEYLMSISVSNHEKIPYQYHRKELNKILQNASVYYDFLNNKEDDYTVKEKIVQLLEFRVPYYVGPLTSQKDNKNFTWVERKYTGEKITPWNFDKIVDSQKSGEKFINKMTNKCTYLKDCDVLPKQSLLFQEYLVYTSINNLYINGARLNDKALKQKLIQAYKEKGTLSKTDIKNIAHSHDSKIKTIGNEDKQDVEQKISLSSFVQLKKIGLKLEHDEDYKIGERIIFLHSIHTDKKIVIKQIEQEFKGKFTNDQLDKIKSLNFAKFSPFSKELLNGITLQDKNTGEERTIIKILEETFLNFMEITKPEIFNFADVLKKYNSKEEDNSNITYQDIEELYGSPSIKRGIWQTVLLTKEIIKITGSAPKKIFIEVTRENKDEKKGKQTNSRRKELQKLLKEEFKNSELLKELEGTSDDKLKSRKLYLYYKQDGRDIYTGEKIDLEKLLTDYDLDHIIPQSSGIKDDSITNNLVLVRKEINQNIKKHYYPIPESIRCKDEVRALWTRLHEKQAISSIKYARLIRTNELSDEEKNEFVSRQLVVTNQSVKAVAELFKDYLPDTKIIYSKAQYVAEFKDNDDESKKIYKNRDMNDLHHAKDAYLNIVVGNVNYEYYEKKFYLEKNLSKNQSKVFFKTIPNVWNPNYSYNSVLKNVSQNDIFVTKKVQEVKGKFYDATIYGKRNATKREHLDQLVPRTQKEPYNNTEKYGGYDSVKGAYFSLLNVEINNKKLNVLEQVPIMVAINNDKTKIAEYFKSLNKYQNIKIIVEKVLIGSLLSWNGGMVYLNGKSEESIVLSNAVQWKPKKEIERYIHIIDKAHKILLDLEKSKGHVSGDNSEGSTQKQQNITKDENIALYDEIITQLGKEDYISTRRTSNRKLLDSSRDKFIDLDLNQQVKVLEEAMKLLGSGGSYSNFELINNPKNIGSLKVSNQLKGSVELINQSITGFYVTKKTLN